ncbi:MAG TPA: hypothetical protein VHW43_09080 [Puia sp.]|nr:hypothetical protein [Puia sp.]
MKATPLIAFILVITVYSCEKVVTDPNLRPLTDAPTGPGRTVDTLKPSPPVKDTAGQDTVTIPTPPFPQHTVDSNMNTNGGSLNSAPSSSCPLSPIYGDTIIFTQPTGGPDYIFNPVNNPGAGRYFSWPVGMVMNQNTGAIDLTTSQTGMKYAIGFVKAGTTDTCMSTLIVGGASYYDSVYVIADNDTTATPYFEANPYLPNICAGGGCTFDVNGAAAAKKVIVDKTTGVINLGLTLQPKGLAGLLGGAFGLLPQNGSSITVPIYYKLNDASNQALESISVQIEYYDSESQVSSGLLGGVLNSLNSLLSGNLISTGANPRPPLIIIVRRH